MKELLKTKYRVLALSVIVLILSNPSERKHKEKFTSVLLEKINEDTPIDQLNPATQVLAMAFINPMIDQAVHRNNYILFSTCEVTWMGKTETAGFGVLGMVFMNHKALKTLD